MPQLSLYIDKSLLGRLEKRARAEKKSLSAWVRERLEENLMDSWSDEVAGAYGSLAELDEFVRPEQPDPESDIPREDF